MLFAGCDYKVKVIAGHGTGYTGGGNPPYPHWDRCFIPCRCTAVYPTFAVMEVQPHRNPAAVFGECDTPYTVTIDLIDGQPSRMFLIKEA